MNISGIRNFINRRFKKLKSYIDLEGVNNQASGIEIPFVINDDVILGAYRNGDAVSKMIFLSHKGIYYFSQNDWNFFSYQDIAGTDMKENRKIENKIIVVSLKDGSKVDLLVEGERSLDGRTSYDIYDFLTFLMTTQKKKK